jgi:hypothetical protein
MAEPDDTGGVRILGVLAIADEPVTVKGIELPKWFEPVVYRPGNSPMSVVLHVEIRNEVPVATGIQARGTTDGTTPATYRDAVDFLKGARLEELLHDAMMLASTAHDWDQGLRLIGKPDGRGLTQEEAYEVAALAAQMREGRPAFPPRPQRRRTITPELLEEVAEVYRQAVSKGEPPTVGVSEQFHVSHRTAARWVAEARKAGVLGAALGTRAGEDRG